MRSSVRVPPGQFAAGESGSLEREWLIREQKNGSFVEQRYGSFVEQRYGSPVARLEGVGSLGSGLHRERKWIRLVRGRRYHRDTGWARLGAEKGGSFLSKVYARLGADGLDVAYDI